MNRSASSSPTHYPVTKMTRLQVGLGTALVTFGLGWVGGLYLLEFNPSAPVTMTQPPQVPLATEPSSNDRYTLETAHALSQQSEAAREAWLSKHFEHWINEAQTLHTLRQELESQAMQHLKAQDQQLNPAWVQLNQQVKEFEEKFAQSAERLTPAHPNWQKLETQRSQLQHELAQVPQYLTVPPEAITSQQRRTNLAMQRSAEQIEQRRNQTGAYHALQQSSSAAQDSLLKLHEEQLASLQKSATSSLHQANDLLAATHVQPVDQRGAWFGFLALLSAGAGLIASWLTPALTYSISLQTSTKSTRRSVGDSAAAYRRIDSVDSQGHSSAKPGIVPRTTRPSRGAAAENSEDEHLQVIGTIRPAQDSGLRASA